MNIAAILDTHAWVWLLDNPSKLTEKQLTTIQDNLGQLGVSVISCWEIAKLCSLGRLTLKKSLRTWFDIALGPFGIHLVSLTLDIAIESNELPGDFHRDPMDQMIVATARHFACPLVTSDEKILSYPHVETIH